MPRRMLDISFKYKIVRRKLISKGLFQKFNVELNKELSVAKQTLGFLDMKGIKKKKNLSKEEKDIFLA